MKKRMTFLRSSHERLDESLLVLGRLQQQMMAYSALFSKMDASGLDSDALAGMSIIFEDMSKKLDTVRDQLNKVFENLAEEKSAPNLHQNWK